MKIRPLVIAALASGFLVTGCANNTQLEQSVSSLSDKVDQLSAQVADLKGGVADAKASSDMAYQEAQRANERIDNMAQSYTK
ncbi:Lpp/OprI family alanine-zipper lipoprotein [Parasalinivibrio latis]|uniref:Lpp/OprI family alanine-zipper lipoprotein n=1 Tax=Parasalinivibrio latis TaxID=2952610 RepID=UPI0030E06E6D